MTFAEIRPLLIALLIGLAALSMVRSSFKRAGQGPVRIPVRFESERKSRRVIVGRLTESSLDQRRITEKVSHIPRIENPK